MREAKSHALVDKSRLWTDDLRTVSKSGRVMVNTGIIVIMADLDQDYRHRIQEAVLDAIIKGSLDPKTNVSLMRTGEIYSALTSVLGMILATSHETATPAKTNRLADDFAKQLKREILASKASGKMPFEVIHPDRMN